MSAPVDVLAAMRRMRDTAQAVRSRGMGHGDDLARDDEAIAAVAELIGADRELDAATDELADAKRAKGSWRVNPLQPTHPAVARVRAARARRAVALVRVGGPTAAPAPMSYAEKGAEASRRG